MKEVYLVEEKEDCKVLSIGRVNYALTRYDVEQKLRIITNGSAMLTDNRVRKFRPRDRRLKF